MKKIMLFIPALAIVLAVSQAFAFGPNSQLCWDKPTANTDGSPVTDLGGYKVYIGVRAGVYGPATDIGLTVAPSVGLQVCKRIGDIQGIPTGVLFAAVSAYDTSGNESAKSNEITFPFDGVATNAPANLLIK